VDLTRRGALAAAATAAACLALAACAAPAQAPAQAPAPAKAAPATKAPSTPMVTPSAAAALPLQGKVIGIDPGHNGRNGADPAYLNQMIWNGRETETCDTTGTQTDDGYPEHAFTFAVATYLTADLTRDGASVVLTRTNDDGVGPCVDKRAQILNAAHSAVAIDIHGDGGPASGRGFTVLEPVADGPNNAVIASSLRFGADVHAAMLADTSMPISDYYGHDGYIPRDDLAGLNLTTVPKVLIECGNMRNATDAALMRTPAFQQRVAAALASAIVSFVTGH
jgi:N-acetylmuramoyl-L-alanine amidase